MTNPIIKTLSDMDRFFKKATLVGSGCIEWTASLDKYGYGRFGMWPKTAKAHRIAYMWANGVKYLNPKELVCHRCDNPKCVNPEHLFLGTHQDNLNDAMTKGRAYTHTGHTNNSGDKHPRKKLDGLKVLEIRELIASGVMSKDIAKMYNVSPNTIWWIKSGRGWK